MVHDFFENIREFLLDIKPCQEQNPINNLS